MPTIQIDERPDRNDKTVSVTVAVNGAERKHTFTRGLSYVVKPEILDVLEHSHEAPYVRVLDRNSQEPTAAELPPSTQDEKEQSGAMAAVLAKAKDKVKEPTPA